MVEIEDIVDRESLEGWLKDQSKEVSVWIARRAATRIFPYYWEWSVKSEIAHKGDFIVLPFLRFYLISEVARKTPNAEIIAHAARAVQMSSGQGRGAMRGMGASHTTGGAYAAPDSAHFVADVALAAADSVNVTARITQAAVDSVYVATDVPDLAADSVDSAFWKALITDCEAAIQGTDLDRLQLWTEDENPLADIWGQLKGQLSVSSPFRSEETARGALAIDWSFWIKWYDSVLAGEPLNGDMLEEIALIEPQEWEKGALYINNEVIAGIVEGYEGQEDGAEDTGFDEETIYDDDTARAPKSVAHLIENKIVSQMAADGLAAQIDDVITRYGQDTGCNDLPEEFQALKALPPVLKQISVLVSQSDGSTEMNKTLVSEIQRLNARIEKLERDLAEAKEKTLKGTFSKSFAEQAGKSLGDWKMWGALGSFAYLAMGGPILAGSLESVLDSIKQIFPDNDPIPNQLLADPSNILEV